MLNSRFELWKFERENREWKENSVLPLSKIKSRKRILSCHFWKSRVEREMETIKFSRSREKFFFLLSIFLSRARLLSMPATQHWPRFHRTSCHSHLSWRKQTNIVATKPNTLTTSSPIRSFLILLPETCWTLMNIKSKRPSKKYSSNAPVSSLPKCSPILRLLLPRLTLQLCPQAWIRLGCRRRDDPVCNDANFSIASPC